MKTKRSFIGQFLKTSLLMAGVFLFMTSIGQDRSTSFGDWDTNQDNRISGTEFSDRFNNRRDNNSGVLGSQDQDMMEMRNDGIDEERFYESSYDWWDTNRDRRLDENEWNRGYDRSYGNYLENDFGAYDIDEDGYLSNDEYNSSFNETDYYRSWDSNNDDLLDNDEYSTGVFDTWDVNDDSYIDENEFGDYIND